MIEAAVVVVVATVAAAAVAAAVGAAAVAIAETISVIEASPAAVVAIAVVSVVPVLAVVDVVLLELSRGHLGVVFVVGNECLTVVRAVGVQAKAPETRTVGGGSTAGGAVPEPA